MNLKSYVSQRYGLASEIAKSLGVTPVTVYEWVHAKKRVPAERCPEIERLTEGAVTCEDLRPDLTDQWAYLRGSGAVNPENTPKPEITTPDVSPEPIHECASGDPRYHPERRHPDKRQAPRRKDGV